MSYDAIKDVADALGGQKAAIAKACGVRPQAVYQWQVIPANRVLTLEKATKAAGRKVSRKQMRPDIYAA